MPITAWTCRIHGEVPLTHWTSGETDPPCDLYSPRLIQAILDDRLNDKVHTGTNLTPTTLLDCPRRVIIERNIPFTASPEDYMTPEIGTLAHEGLAARPLPPIYQGKLQHSVKVEGNLFGQHLQGKIDVLISDGTLRIIEDDKFTNPYSLSRKEKEGASEDHRAQVSMYALLLQQSITRTDLKINYYGVGSGKGAPPHIRCPVEPMTEEDIERHTPGGGQQTVRQNVDNFVSAFNNLDRPFLTKEISKERVHEVIRTLPLAGQSMWRGRKGECYCTAYCPVAKICLGEIEGKPGLML